MRHTTPHTSGGRFFSYFEFFLCLTTQDYSRSTQASPPQLAGPHDAYSFSRAPGQPAAASRAEGGFGAIIYETLTCIF